MVFKTKHDSKGPRLALLLKVSPRKEGINCEKTFSLVWSLVDFIIEIIKVNLTKASKIQESC